MILACHEWPTNGHLVADVAQLYIDPDDVVCDLTFGRGVWWKQYHHPGQFVGCCRTWEQLQARMEEGWDSTRLRLLPDFRDLRNLTGNYEERIDVITFDPPYVAPGGRDTSTIPDFNDRYGLVDAAATPIELHWHNVLGMQQAFLALAPKGRLLVKCMDYVSSGKVQWVTDWTDAAAREIGFVKLDRFEHKGHVRSQPAGRRQVHARRNLSTLFVYQKPRKAKAS